MNGDVQDNDILFVPASASDVVVVGGTWDELNAYIESDSSMKNLRGTIPERNQGRAPWTNLVDFRLAFDVAVRQRNQFQVTIDVSNFLNWLNEDWGVVRLPQFQRSVPCELRWDRCGDREDDLQSCADEIVVVPEVRDRRSPVSRTGTDRVQIPVLANT